MELIIGTYIENVECISFLDSETNRVRVKTIGNVALPDGLIIECSKAIRDEYDLGTHFTTENVKICKKTEGRYYLRAKNQMIYPK